MGGQCAVPDDAERDWYCADLVGLRQLRNGCLPACIAMLMSYLGHTQRSPAHIASAWGQALGALFDTPAMYNRLRAFCVLNGMSIELDYNRRRQPIEWRWLRALRRPTLLVFDGHAQICIGTCPTAHYQEATVPSYCVLDPTCGYISWLSFPRLSPLYVDFAISAPGKSNCSAPAQPG